MQKITLNIDVNKTLEIVHELKTQGWRIGNDFEFAYHKEMWDDFSSEPISEHHTVFTFYNDSNASYFMLRWG